MEDIFISAVVFTGIYQIIKVFTDFLLKRRMVINGHVDKAGILDTPSVEEKNTYPTLKWGLIVLFAGLGLLIISMLDRDGMFFMDGRNSYLPLGIELIAVSAGFLFYFFIVRMIKK
jgi:hypothetical protein